MKAVMSELTKKILSDPDARKEFNIALRSKKTSKNQATVNLNGKRYEVKIIKNIDAE